MKFRAVANGNIVDDVPEGLVAAGIYVPVGEGEPTPVAESEPEPPAPEPDPVKETAVEPLGTTDVPTKPRKRGRGKRGK